MKILILSHSCVTPENQAQFASLERETGWTVGLVAPETWNTEYNTERRLERGSDFRGPLFGLPVYLSGNIPLHAYRRGFKKILATFAPDVIYAHHEPYGVATAQLYRVNARTLRRPIGFFTWQNLEKRYPAPIRQIERWVYGQSSFAISGSESARDVLKKKGVTCDVTVVPAGLDPAIYDVPEAADELRTKLLNRGEEILVGYVGRVAEEKGMDTLLEALARVDNPLWRLVVVGSGPFDSAFDAKASRLGLSGRITRQGYVPHDVVPAYLAACDLLVLPSETRTNWKEQFGRVIIEAAAASTAVVGSSSGEIPNVIRSIGGGIVFKEGDAVSLADSIGQLLENPPLRLELARRGRSSVIGAYSNEAVSAKLASAIEHATRGGRNKHGH